MNYFYEKLVLLNKSFYRYSYESYNKKFKYGIFPFIFRKEYWFKNTEQYKISMENRTFETLVHYLYWDNTRYRVKLRKNVDNFQTKKLIM